MNEGYAGTVENTMKRDVGDPHDRAAGLLWVQRITELHLDLCCWMTRRPLETPMGAFGTLHGNTLLPLVLTMTFIIPLETGLLVVMIPRTWWPVSILMTVFSLECVLLMWALYASLHRRPHVVGVEAVRLTWTALMRYDLDYRAITAVRLERRPTGTGQFGILVPGGGTTAFIVNGPSANVTLDLRQPIALPTAFGAPRLVSKLHLCVDLPDQFVAAIERRLGTLR